MLKKKERKAVLRNIVFTLLISGLLLGIAGFSILTYVRSHVYNESFNDVAAIANLKNREINRWLTERSYEGIFLQNNPDFLHMLSQLIKNNEDDLLKTRIGEWVKPILTNHDYCGMHVYDLDGKLVSSFIVDYENLITTGFTNRTHFHPLPFDSILISDLYYDHEADHYHIDFSIPIFYESERIAALVLTVDATRVLLPLVEELPVYRTTAETFLLKKEGDSLVYLSGLRFSDQKPLEFKEKAGSVLLPVGFSEIAGRDGFFKGSDYRIEEVVAKVIPIPRTNWFLVSKIDRSEILAPVFRQTLFVLLIGLALLVAIAAVLISIWKRNEAALLRRQLVLDKETRALEKHYGYLTRYANDIIMLLDDKGNLIQMNEKGLEKYGYSEKEIMGMNIRRLRAGSTHSRLPRQLEEVLKKGHIVIESVHVTKNEEEFPVEISARSIEIDGAVFIQSIVRDITNRKKYEKAILERESQLSSIFKVAPVGIGLVSDRVIINVNDKVCEMTGYTQDELISKSARILYPEQKDFEYVGSEKYRQIKKSGIGEVETRWQHKNGSIIDVLLRSTPLDPNDAAKGFMFTALDITERKRAEQSILEGKRTLTTLMSNLQGIVYRCRNDKDWTMLFLSDGFKLLTGFEPEDYLEKGNHKYTELIHPDDRGVVWEIVQRALDEKQPYEIEYRMKTSRGEYFWALEKGRGVYDQSDELLFLEGIITNIAWRKRNEEIQQVVFNIANAVNFTNSISELAGHIRDELKRIINTENFLIALYDETQDTISLPFMADSKDVFDEFPAGKTLTAYVIANNLPLLIDDKEIAAMAEEGVIEYNGTISKSWLGVPLRIHERVIGALVIQDYNTSDAFTLNDLELLKFVSNQIALSIEKKRYEDALLQAKEKAVEADKLKTAFLANMSHEIRTPMNAIIGFSDLLADKGLKTKEREGFVNIIQNNGNVLLNLIDDIIDMAKLEAGQIRIHKQVSSVNEILDELYNYFVEFRHKMDKSGIELRFPQYKAGKVEILTDPIRFRQIISNLLNNALKFTDIGFVEFGYDHNLPDTAPEDTPSRAIVFYVKDTGIGIPSDKLSLVFDRFRQAFDSHARILGGTGLGLTISRNLAELLGGKLWVESELGHGTIFYLALPASEKLPELANGYEPAQVDELEDFDGSTLRVLIVEDDSSSAFFLRRAISRIGAEVLHAANGFEAIDLAKNNPDIDLVFMDIRMPGIDGYEATEKIKEMLPDLPVVAQTAYAMPDEVQKSICKGCDGHITKPLRTADIIAALKKFTSPEFGKK